MDKMTYKRKVDKAEIPICNIMGVNIAAINMKWLLDYLEKNLSNLKGDYICVSNVHTTVMSYEELFLLLHGIEGETYNITNENNHMTIYDIV